MMKKIVLLLLLVPALQGMAQDTAYARRLIRDLSSPQMYGRGYSHHGDSIAAEYLRAEMRRLGVRPLADDYLQHYTFDVYGMEGPCSVTLNGKRQLKPYAEFRILNAARYATGQRLLEAKWKKLVDGVWFIGKKNLDTFSPVATANTGGSPVCVEILESALPKHVRKVECQIPLQYHPGYRSQNVCGMVPGEVDTMVVFTAHYDHCGTLGDAVYFPGAHDNASGTAAVMDLAREATLQKPHYTLVFMLFSGEEVGLKGSRYAAEYPLFDFDKVKLLVNLDMFCGGDEGFAVVNANADNTRAVVDRMVRLNDTLQVAATINRRDNAANSDHYWFSSHCPAIFIYTMGASYGGYHDPYDDCKSCGLSHYENFLNLIAGLAL